MGFRLDISMPDMEASQSATVVDWLAPSHRYVGWDLPILRLSVEGRDLDLVCNMPVVVVERLVAAGDLVTSGSRLAMVEAEGDEIPYGKPYGRLEPPR